MSLQELLQQIINGLAVGSIYALIALGYTMVYGILRLINFAHGDIYMMGAFIGYWTSAFLLRWFATLKLPAGSPWAVLTDHPALAIFLTVPVAMAGCALLGVLIERLAYKPLRRAPRHSLLITAIGISFLLEYLMMALVGPDQKVYARDPWLTQQMPLGFGLSISADRLLIIGVSVVLMLLLQALVQYSRVGKAMRAVSADQDATRLMGIDVDRVISFTFGLGSALAGAAGVLIGMQFNITPLMGISDGLKAFIAAVLGGIGLIPGAMLGSYTLGIVETLVKGLHLNLWGVQPSLLADAVAFAILILILLVKPAGLLGKAAREKV